MLGPELKVGTKKSGSWQSRTNLIILGQLLWLTKGCGLTSWTSYQRPIVIHALALVCVGIQSSVLSTAGTRATQRRQTLYLQVLDLHGVLPSSTLH